MGVEVSFSVNSDEEARQGIGNVCLKRQDPYPVYFFKSDTSGEKLYEEFYTKEDTLELDSF